MDKQHLTAALKEITLENLPAGKLGDLWSKLPDYVAGPNWLGEIADAASQWLGYIYEDKDYQLEDLLDYIGELANSECEDYYTNINKRVQALSLWAYPELDNSVLELIDPERGDLSLTGLNSLYLYAAMDSLYRCVIEYAYDRAAELESELANA
jgi:hypothetical protein